MKYPGAFILNEYGTNKELAKIYGVSERTIYRWKDKAKKETGARAKKPLRPRNSTLINFKGTRKQLAKKYNVSERTVYRWLRKAKEEGAEIEPRQNKSRYPGAQILLEDGTNKELAEKYNVSKRTITRWKRRAEQETAEEEPFEVLPPDEQPEPVGTEEDFYNETFGDEYEEPEKEDKDFHSQIEDIFNILDEYNLINEKSLIRELPKDLQLRYLSEYIMFQQGENPYRFYEIFGDWDIHWDDPNGLAMVNIWGEEFDSWVKNQIEIDKTL